jgi:hypothetical protein
MKRMMKWLVAALCALTLMAAAQTSDFSITGKPRWFKVTTTEPCVVRDLATHNPIGTLQNGDQIISFGVTEKFVTFAYQGRVAYVPASAVEEAFRVVKGEPQWRGPGPTLEERVKKTQKELIELAEDKERLLNPDLKKPKESEQQQQSGAMSGAMSGVENSVRGGLTPEGGRGKGYY